MSSLSTQSSFGKSSNISSPLLTTDPTHVQRQRWHELLVAINRVQLILSGLALLFWAGIYLISQEIALLLASELVTLSLVFSGLSLLLLLRPKAGWLEAATFVAVFGNLLVIGMGTSLLGTSSGTLAMFFWAPILVSLLGLSVQVIVGTTILTIISIVISISLQSSGMVKPALNLAAEFPVASIFVWAISLLLVLAGLLTFSRRLQKALRETSHRALQLTDLTTKLQQITEFSADLSRELGSVTAELYATSRQQASGSQEQLAAVNQVTSSLEELGQSASQIAGSAEAAAQSATHTVEIATQLREANDLAEITATQGTEAVEQATFSVGRVQQRIELLGQRLLDLTEQTRKVGLIIDLIDEVADETHLLALNASIEAADGGSSDSAGGGIQSTRGKRFGVIAQEIKNLSDRSREATEEVRVTISEMQGAVAAAVLVAEEGRKDTVAALSRSQIAGGVIYKLNQVVDDSAEGANRILVAVEEVKIRCEEISLATNQQRTANQQILATMRGVSQVSQQSANAVAQLAETVSRVTNRVGELNIVLDKSRELMPIAAAM